jgi:hypothetical protein
LRGQAQQNPNSAKAPAVEAEHKENKAAIAESKKEVILEKKMTREEYDDLQ